MTGKLTTALLGGLIAIGGASAAIAAGVPRPLSGSVQGYVGSGLPVPIRAKGTAMDASCLPLGAIHGVKAKAGAMITTYPSRTARSRWRRVSSRCAGPATRTGPR